MFEGKEGKESEELIIKGVICKLSGKGVWIHQDTLIEANKEAGKDLRGIEASTQRQEAKATWEYQ